MIVNRSGMTGWYVLRIYRAFPCAPVNKHVHITNWEKSTFVFM